MQFFGSFEQTRNSTKPEERPALRFSLLELFFLFLKNHHELKHFNQHMLHLHEIRLNLVMILIISFVTILRRNFSRVCQGDDRETEGTVEATHVTRGELKCNRKWRVK